MSIKLGSTDFSKAYVGANSVDKIAVGSNVIYYGLVTSNLKIHIDAENPDSYSGSGTSVTDLQGNQDATLSNAVFNNTTPKNWELDENPPSDPNRNHTSFIAFNEPFELFNAPQDFTFSIWFQFPSVIGDNDIITKGAHATNRPVLVWYDALVQGGTDVGNARTISFMVHDGSGNQHWVSAPTDSITVNQIYNLVVQHNTDGQSRIWINGVKKRDHTDSTTNGMLNNDKPLKIGAATGTTSTADSDIKVYAFHAYDSFLTDAQIDQNWNHLKGRFGL